MLLGSRGMLNNLPRSVKAGALGVSVVLSAALTAVVLRSPDHHWLAWISFVPLFVAVRWLRAPEAALVGGLWGACLGLFSAGGPMPVIALSAWLLALLIVIPAVYVGLAARPARAIGFNLLTLALGWTLVETVVAASSANVPEPRVSARADVPYEVQATPKPRGANTGHFSGQPTAPLRSRLGSVAPNGTRSISKIGGAGHVAGTGSASRVRHADHETRVLPVYQRRSAPRTLPDAHVERPPSHWLACLIGYISMAFLVAWANASLVSILSNAHLSLPVQRSLTGPPKPIGWLRSQAVPAIQSWTFCQAYPRAPPDSAAVQS